MVGFHGVRKAGDVSMPQIKLTVEFAFQQGEQKAVYSALVPSVVGSPQEEFTGSPYALPDATGPQEPMLISSNSFVQVG